VDFDAAIPSAIPDVASARTHRLHDLPHNPNGLRTENRHRFRSSRRRPESCAANPLAFWTPPPCERLAPMSSLTSYCGDVGLRGAYPHRVIPAACVGFLSPKLGAILFFLNNLCGLKSRASVLDNHMVDALASGRRGGNPTTPRKSSFASCRHRRRTSPR
jgi:hypothetical protein